MLSLTCQTRAVNTRCQRGLITCWITTFLFHLSFHLDAPVILPESSCHLIGEVLKCICQAEASPKASIYWTIDGNDTFPSSFSLVSTNKKNFVSAEISGPATSQSNISCTATNSLGSNSKQLSVYNLSKICRFPYSLGVVCVLSDYSQKQINSSLVYNIY